MKIHTIPVPRGWSVEQAWEAIKRGDPPPKELYEEDGARWANVETDDKDRFVKVRS